MKCDMEVVYILLSSVAKDGGAREFFMDEKPERKRRIYTTFMAHPRMTINRSFANAQDDKREAIIWDLVI